jgi:hypothetical protein
MSEKLPTLADQQRAALVTTMTNAILAAVAKSSALSMSTNKANRRDRRAH